MVSSRYSAMALDSNNETLSSRRSTGTFLCGDMARNQSGRLSRSMWRNSKSIFFSRSTMAARCTQGQVLKLTRRYFATVASNRFRSDRISLLPGHQRGVDHVGNALATHRTDCKIDVFEPEAVGRDLFQREAFRGELGQSKLAGLETVAARAFHGDELDRKFFQRKIRELRQLALHHDGAALALECFDAEEDRNGAGAGGAVERHVDAFAASDFHDARERIFLLHVDHVLGAQFFGDLHPRAVLRRSGDDDEGSARLVADHRLR